MDNAMQKFFCATNERVMISKVFDYFIRNCNVNAAHLNAFLNILSDNLGLDSLGYDEITIDEFEDEFLEHFKNNSCAKDSWIHIKQELEENNCELWV